MGYSHEDSFVFRYFALENEIIASRNNIENDLNETKKINIYMKENSELQNNLATHLLMNQDCKGDYIVYKTKTVISDNNSDNHDISNFGDVNESPILLPVTRREIWTISE